MMREPPVQPPARLVAPVPSCTGSDAEQHLHQDLQTLRQIVEQLDALEERLNVSPIPKAVTARGYFTPDEDDRVRQGVLLYRNCRLAAYNIILRYRAYASIDPPTLRLKCFLVAFGAALLLYSKSLKIIDFAEHVPMLRAKINEPDRKYDLEEGFFEDVVLGYSRIGNYRAILQAAAFWRAHRREAQVLAREAGGEWAWLIQLIRHQRYAVRSRLMHVLWQRLRRDRRAFCRTLLSPFQKARQGLEGVLSERLAAAEITGQPGRCIPPEMLASLRSGMQFGDVLLMRNDGRLTAAILPGFWTHAAIFLGAGRAELESQGLRSHPRVAKHWQQVPEAPGPLGLVIESVAPFVLFNPLEKCLQADHVLVLRPLLDSGEIAAAIGEAMGHLGKSYDFEFDFNNSSRVVCTELVYRSYHKRGNILFSLTKRLGRFTLTGDDIVGQVLDGLAESDGKKTSFKPVAMLLRRRDGLIHMVSPDRIVLLLRRIRRGWRPAARVKTGNTEQIVGASQEK